MTDTEKKWTVLTIQGEFPQIALGINLFPVFASCASIIEHCASL